MQVIIGLSQKGRENLDEILQDQLKPEYYPEYERSARLKIWAQKWDVRSEGVVHIEIGSEMTKTGIPFSAEFSGDELILEK